MNPFRKEYEVEIDIAIANADGWTDIDVINAGPCFGFLISGRHRESATKPVPRYCYDQEALSDIERRLSPSQLDKYCCELGKLPIRTFELAKLPITHKIILANTWQRAKCLSISLNQKG